MGSDGCTGCVNHSGVGGIAISVNACTAPLILFNRRVFVRGMFETGESQFISLLRDGWCLLPYLVYSNQVIITYVATDAERLVISSASSSI